jgi:hypothetical protein
LLLTLEGVATALMAWFIFHENFDRRVALGMACLVATAAVLAWSGQPTLSGLLRPLAITGACAAWGLDNSLTRKVSLADPLVHEPLEHSHPHVHDAHPRHAHAREDPPGEPHTHWHRHARLVHTHPHVPDMHHTHDHAAAPTSDNAEAGTR